MKTKLLISISIEIIITGGTGLILNTNKMEIWIILIFIGIFIVLATIGYFSIIERLRKYNHANNIQLFTHLSILVDVFNTHPEIENIYNEDIDGMRRLNPLKEETLWDLFIFDKDSNFKEMVKKKLDELNRNNKQIPD